MCWIFSVFLSDKVYKIYIIPSTFYTVYNHPLPSTPSSHQKITIKLKSQSMLLMNLIVDQKCFSSSEVKENVSNLFCMQVEVYINSTCWLGFTLFHNCFNDWRFLSFITFFFENPICAMCLLHHNLSFYKGYILF